MEQIYLQELNLMEYFFSNNGSNRKPINTGLPVTFIYAIGNGGNNMFTVTDQCGLYWSTYNGDTRTPLNDGLH